ncbi:superantigen-like protein SSL4 [Streptomyces griseosporeus]|uniref:hypothetical protein n=1 Tax=Streptomyces griseosporeus TaxID=1910 RepID=UPI00369A3642
MTRTTRRHILPLTGASAVVTALTLTMGPATATPGAAGADEFPSSVRADSSPPGPQDSSGGSGASTPPSPSTPDNSDSSPSPTPDDTTPPSGEVGGAPAVAAVEQQQQEAGNLATDLDDKKADVPEDLVSSVDQLTGVLEAVNDTQTPPQERDGAVRSARQVDNALDAIADPGTPDAVRDRLTALVPQVSAALDAANGSQTPPESGALGLIVARTASVLRVVTDQDTPADVEATLVDGAENLLSAVQNGTPIGNEGAEAAADTRAAGGQLEWKMLVSNGLETAGNPNTPEDERKGLANSAHEGSETQPGDPESEQKKLRLKKDLREAISEQGLPDEPLGKAAEVCTNSVFESVLDTTLADDLEPLTPETWNSEGIRDFWKSREAANDSLDVIAQLQNDKLDNTALAIKRMIPQLADSLPADELYSSLGMRARDCLQAAAQLDDEMGVQSGSWLSEAQQV